MGQYKVPQNVEAEDKIIGFLTLKQFIYSVIGVMSGLISFLTLRKAPVVMLIVGIPPTALFLLLGLYQRQDQPFEALFLSLVSFLAKPRKRLWIKEPIEEVFKIEAPKVVKAITQRDPHEVRGQLEQLSQVVDTRGWGNKKAELQEPSEVAILEDEGRLVAPSAPEHAETIETDVRMSDDILDFQNNPNARGLGDLIQDQAKSIREQAMAALHHQAPASDSQKSDGAAPAAQPQEGEFVRVGNSELTTDYVPLPGTTYRPAATTTTEQAAESASTTAADQANSQTSTAAAMLSPASNSTQTGGANNQPASAGASKSDMTANPLDGILKLAMENDDLPVSQVAAQANRQQSLAEGQSVSLRKNGNT